MANKEHRYQVHVIWTGNQGTGTATYRGYSRAHEIQAPGKPTIKGSSDPSFRGDPARWNPEELLLASLSACHKLWYLGLCTSVTLKPKVALAPGADIEKAQALHRAAHEKCFIARSVNFAVGHEAQVVISD